MWFCEWSFSIEKKNSATTMLVSFRFFFYDLSSNSIKCEKSKFKINIGNESKIKSKKKMKYQIHWVWVKNDTLGLEMIHNNAYTWEKTYLTSSYHWIVQKDKLSGKTNVWNGNTFFLYTSALMFVFFLFLFPFFFLSKSLVYLTFRKFYQKKGHKVMNDWITNRVHKTKWSSRICVCLKRKVEIDFLFFSFLFISHFSSLWDFPFLSYSAFLSHFFYYLLLPFLW